MRCFLEKVSDTGPERSKTLGEVRIRNDDLKAQRERQQNEAYNNYRRSRDEQREQQTTAATVQDFPRDMDGAASSPSANLFVSTGQAAPRSDPFVSPTTYQYSDGLGLDYLLDAHGSFDPGPRITHEQHADSSPDQQLPRRHVDIEPEGATSQEIGDSDDESKLDANIQTQEVNVDSKGKRKRRLLPNNALISRILRHLNHHLSPAKARLNKFLVRQLTVTEEPVQSRVGTDAWLPQHDEDSEYMRFYNFPRARDEQMGVASAGSGGSSDIQQAPGICDPPAIAFFKRAKLESIDNGMDSISDAEVARQLEHILSTMSSSDRKSWVNAQDIHGVAALALAIAYGLPAMCGQLLDCEADHRMKTVGGARPHDFALAAERIAGKTNCLKLYMRIMMCREFVRYGINPTAPRPSTKTGFRGLPKYDDGTRSQAQTAHASEGIAARDHAYGRGPDGPAVTAAADHQPSAKEMEANGSVGGIFGLELSDAPVAPQRDGFITQAQGSSATNFAMPDKWRAGMLPTANVDDQPFTPMDDTLSESTFQQPLPPSSSFPNYTDPKMLPFDSPLLPQQTHNPINPPMYEDRYAQSMLFQPTNSQYQYWPAQAGAWNVPEAPQVLNNFSQQQQQTQGMYDHNPFRRRSQPIAPTGNYVERPLQLTPSPESTRQISAFAMPNFQPQLSGNPYQTAVQGFNSLTQTYMTESQEHHQ